MILGNLGSGGTLSDEFVDVKCKECGNEMSFCPQRVMVLRGCPCGNEDYGSPKGWSEYNFGNFTFVRKYYLVVPSAWRFL